MHSHSKFQVGWENSKLSVGLSEKKNPILESIVIISVFEIDVSLLSFLTVQYSFWWLVRLSAYYFGHDSTQLTLTRLPSVPYVNK